MTAQQLDKGFKKDAQESAASRCKLTVTTNTRSEYAADKPCKTQGGVAYEAKVHFQYQRRQANPRYRGRGHHAGGRQGDHHAPHH